MTRIAFTLCALAALVIGAGCKGPSGPDGEDAALPDSLSPQVAWLAPETGAVIDSAVILAASATDDNGVWRMSFYVGGFEFPATLIDSTEGIYHYDWLARDFPPGPYPLMARAWDEYRNSATTPVVMVEVRRGGG